MFFQQLQYLDILKQHSILKIINIHKANIYLKWLKYIFEMAHFKATFMYLQKIDQLAGLKNKMAAVGTYLAHAQWSRAAILFLDPPNSIFCTYMKVALKRVINFRFSCVNNLLDKGVGMKFLCFSVIIVIHKKMCK